jgi:hypothetical protein
MYLVKNLNILVLLKYKHALRVKSSQLTIIFPFLFSLYNSYILFSFLHIALTANTLPLHGLECFFYILNYLSGANNSCIPYRLEQNVEGCYGSSENKLLVLMISTPNRDDLVFPKVSITLLCLLST